MIRKNLLPVFCILFICSCVPASKQILLQGISEESKLAEKGNFSRMVEEIDFQYRLQPGDVVSIKISSLTPSEFNFFSSLEDQQNERLDPLLTGFLIDKEGYIVLPHVGNIVVKGLTVTEAQEKIKRLIDNLLDTPTVYVRLVSFDFSILGEVERQGKYSIYEDKINILEAIGLGGGLTDFADGENIKVVRTENGVTGISLVNVLEEDIVGSHYYYLKPNDIVIVPPLKSKNFQQNQSSNISLIFAGLATLASVILVFDRFTE